ncbi:MAG: hypothetical protein ACLRMZ_27765 [Blautia marasmi]
MVAEALTSKTVIFLVPVVAVLPYGDVDRGKGFRISGVLCCPEGEKDFVEDRVITTTCSGCFGWALAVLITLLLYFVLFFSLELKAEWRWELMIPLLRDHGKAVFGVRRTGGSKRHYGASVRLCVYGIRDTFCGILPYDHTA